jgi:nicotinamide-nucleotide amidase
MQKSYEELVGQLSDKLREKKWMVACAESCTGGMIASAITDLAGSSSVFDRGFVTYSNKAKMEMLSVSRETLGEHGAVSPETATEMARGVLQHSSAQIAVSVTGIAGPTGGSDEKPVGLVYIGIATKEGCFAHHRQCDGSRAEIRGQTVEEALKLLLEQL